MGRVGAAMQKWGLVDSANCECRDPLQTVEHVITSGPKHRPPNGDWGLIDLDDETLDWLALMELKVFRRTSGEEVFGEYFSDLTRDKLSSCLLKSSSLLRTVSPQEHF